MRSLFILIFGGIVLISCNRDNKSKVTMVNFSCDYKMLTVKKIDLADLSPPAQFINHIIHDSSGNLFFSQFNYPVVGKLSPSGDFSQWIGKPGNGPGDFSSAYISIDPYDSLVVHDHFLERVSIFAPNDYEYPFRIFSLDRNKSEFLITATTNDSYIFQKFPYHNLSFSQDSVFTISSNRYITEVKHINSIYGQDLIVDISGTHISTSHTVDRRNVTFNFQPDKFAIFQNDIDRVLILDYDGIIIQEISLQLPDNIDHSLLLKLEVSLSGDFSGMDKSDLVRRSKIERDRGNTYSKYFEGVLIDEKIFIKLFPETNISAWQVYNLSHDQTGYIIYCHDDVLLSIKGHNGFYYYGTGITENLEEFIYLLRPVKADSLSNK